MNRQAIVLGILATVVAAVGCGGPSKSSRKLSESGKHAKSYGDSQAQIIADEFRVLLKTPELEEKEKQELSDWHDEAFGDIKDWYSENGPKIMAIRREAIEAAKEKDLQKLKELKRPKGRRSVEEMVNEERALLNKYRASLEDQIPTEAKSAWKAEIVSKQLLEFLEPLNLTEDQIRRVRELAPESLSRLNRKQRLNWRGYGTSGLEKIFGEKVVVDAQRDAFDSLKARNRIRMMKWSQTF